MKLHQTSYGFLMAIGFDMIKRMADPRMIMWDDPTSKLWDPGIPNLAGSQWFGFDIRPEFVRNTEAGFVIYQPGLLLEARFDGQPYAWSFLAYRPGGEGTPVIPMEPIDR